MYLFLGKALINLIPLVALAAIVSFIGYNQPAQSLATCRPYWLEQLLSVLDDRAGDCIDRPVTGHYFRNADGARAERFIRMADQREPHWRHRLVSAMAGFGNGAMRTLSRFTDLFRNPVTNRELVDDQYHMYLGRPLVSFNSCISTVKWP